MSNDVDVLLVGGAASGMVVCAPRPVGTFIDVPSSGGQTRYNHFAYSSEYFDGKQFHIATPAGESVPDDLVITNAIIGCTFPPAWDLN